MVEAEEWVLGNGCKALTEGGPECQKCDIEQPDLERALTQPGTVLENVSIREDWSMSGSRS